jgi:adenylosuccinate synthase
MTHVTKKEHTTGVTVVVGSQWGNEGKGKLVSHLCGQADVCARFNGGANNIHTLSIDTKGDARIGRDADRVDGGTSLVLRLLPLGVMNKKCDIVFGNGMVIHLPTLVEEIRAIEGSFDPNLLDRLHVSSRAQIVFDFHLGMDHIFEDLRGSKIGTTQKGIGPAYSTKTIRNGIRIGDLFGEKTVLKDKLSELVSYFVKYHAGLNVDVESELATTMKAFSYIESRVVDTVSLMARFMTQKKRIICEGANSVFSDIDFGTYPYVTSSNTTVGAASVGLGISPTKLTNIIGVCKSYTSRSQHWFPSVFESADPIAKRIITRGKEVGTTSNKARRVGWLDLVQVKYGQDISGFDSLMLTKLDALSGLDKIGLVVAYKGMDVDSNGYPSTIEEFERIEPVVEFMDGWSEELGQQSIKSFDDLPVNAKNYIARIEQFVGVQITRLQLRGNDIIERA